MTPQYDQMNGLTGQDARMTVERMGEAANNLLAALSPDQKLKAAYPFSAQRERTNWNYTPRDRGGLSLAEMERHQQRLAHQLVASGLSRAGYVAASTIMGLETTLDAVEEWRRSGRGRDPLLYYVSIFGTPSFKEPWGWRFEGHHISLNYTIVDGKIVVPTPTFFGANPAESHLSGASLLRPLAGIEDVARELVHELDDAQRADAILSPAAPTDVVTINLPQVREGSLPISSQILMGRPVTSATMDAFERQRQKLGLSQERLEALRYTQKPKGLAAATMTPEQQEMLTTLIHEYIDRMPGEIAEIEFAKLEEAGITGIHFAWAGGLEPNQPHYYRLQDHRFLVEYDNTQNDANHIHSVWRDPDNDFGANLLSQHYAQSH